VYTVAASFVLIMTITVGLRPAIRAARIDPAITIRTE
jgi:ABC-type lipoprotein release transport system permease subunit